ncbi:STAS domain-containing protein [Alkalihalobacillus sp. TS-13]|uniref:STAS domain-containing protein n=1 Tax=Alkalihalobacillus sp. TS-13 TaxID=2842455 RepID=UPI001C8822F7|nr:STAS domain-containing protein [Alkalihalobacillus sp. TS-13]
MSIRALAEKILFEKETIAEKTRTIFTEKTGLHLNEQVTNDHVLLAEFVASGLTAEDTTKLDDLMREWAERASENTLKENKQFEHSFERFQIFKNQIWIIIENQLDGESPTNKELFRILRKVELMIDKAGFEYVRAMVQNFETKVTDFEKTMKKDKQLIADLSVPIIPSIVPNTILVPIVGLLTNERFEILRQKLLNNIPEQNAESIVCDFTGAVIPENGEFHMGDLAHQIEQITKALSLMGVEIIYVGFSSRLVQEIVRSGVTIDAETFSTFRTGLKYLANQKKWQLDEQHLDEMEEDEAEKPVETLPPTPTIT